ncbi:MAG: efflux RND transporter periplasmic adaptor subunit [Gammaproteobacteria bacterium]
MAVLPRRILGLWGVLVLVLAGLAWGFWPRPVLVEAARVTEAPLTVTVEEEGRTRIKDRFVISAPVAGYLRRIDREVGDVIARDQVLAWLDPVPSAVLDPRSRAEAEARVASAEAALRVARERVDAARAEADYARLTYDRKQQLRREGTVPEQEVDQAHSLARQAAANLRSSEFGAQVARYELVAARTTLQHAGRVEEDGFEPVPLRSPVNGQVLKLTRKSEGVVGAGEPLIEVGDPTSLEVEVDLLSADAVRVRPGTPVSFQRWGGEVTLAGAVRTVEPVGFTKISALGVEEQRVWVIADILSPREQWSALGDGYRVEASFVLWHADRALQVPTSALFRHAEGRGVFVVEADRARLRPVGAGHRSGLAVQVLTGLAAGELVITHPDDRIQEGTRVAAR